MKTVEKTILIRDDFGETHVLRPDRVECVSLVFSEIQQKWIVQISFVMSGRSVVFLNKDVAESIFKKIATAMNTK